jgi:3-oxoacyl-[acyl-carrier protein] reductase
MASNSARLSGKVAFITGAGGGVGAATAMLFAQEGASISIVDKDEDRLALVAAEIQSAGGEAVCIHNQADIADLRSVQKAIDRTMDKCGAIHILLNIAGLTKDAISWKMTEEQWDSVIDVNLKGTFNCCKSVMPIMRSQRYGKIVNTSSVSSLGNVGQVNYSAAKAGLIGFTRTLALEAASHGINVNCVAPGFIDTPMTQAMPQDILRSIIEQKVPLRRLGKPEELAKLFLYLASEDSSFMTGQVLFFDGGISVGI